MVIFLLLLRSKLSEDHDNMWETDFYTPPVLEGAALFDSSAPAVYKIQGP